MLHNDELQELLRIQGLYYGYQRVAQAHFSAVLIAAFSQCSEPVATVLRTCNAGKPRVSSALVARWMSARAAGGSLWNTLYSNGPGTGQIDVRAMGAIAIAAAHDIHCQPEPSKFSGLFATATGGHPQTYGPGDPLLAQKVISEFPKLKTCRSAIGGYAVIEISGGVGGHCLGIHLGARGGTVSLPFCEIGVFDPNVGEYWFLNASDFERFLKWTFGYLYTEFGSYALRAYAKN